MRVGQRTSLDGIDVLDGGMATELERRGANIRGPLWSAHVLESEPEKVVAVHRAYLEAGADCLLTASYQVSRMGYREFGLDDASADRALLNAVELADQTRREFPGRPVWIGASLGPYGAALHNGAEYTGDYACSFNELVRFHRERIEVLAESEADFLVFETLPSIDEAHAIGEALAPWPEVAVWLCFTCPDAQAAQLRVAHGELLRDCAALAASFPQTAAVGVNCTHPRWITSLVGELRAASDKPIVVYPNSGEGWDAERRCWTGESDAASFGDQAREWFEAGAQVVGGCCRTGPEHIRQIAKAAAEIAPGRA